MARKPKNQPIPSAPQLAITYRKTDELVPYAKNAMTHSPHQVSQIAASIREFGWTNPILVDGDRGVIAGHGRLMAAHMLGLAEVPTIELAHLTPAQRQAYIIADNKLAMGGVFDEDMLRIELGDLLNQNFDLELLGFDNKELEELLNLFPGGAGTSDSDAGGGTLADKFGAPPFSVLDTRQGYWQDRKAQWGKIVGNASETKEQVLDKGGAVSTINEGSSNFDPVLAELMLRWFCPPQGYVLDPFGGEQTKGVVAGELALTYHAVEIRPEQVDLNMRKTAAYGAGVHYFTGDAEQIDTLVAGGAPAGGYDCCLTSPPYYDLEVYSKDDMSALGTYAEFMAKYERIFAKCVALLRDGAFLVIKVGEIRDKKTGVYRNFVGDNIAMFQRLGLAYYNELTLISPAGTAPIRAASYFASRKMVKLHQNVLVFWKGNPKDIKARFAGITDGADLSTDTTNESE
jgi:ParB-like nuclease domain/DNA methylase